MKTRRDADAHRGRATKESELVRVLMEGIEEAPAGYLGLSEDEIKAVTDALAGSVIRMTSQDTTIRVFEELLEALRRRHRTTESLYYATDLLLCAVEAETLHWKHLREIAAHRVCYEDEFDAHVFRGRESMDMDVLVGLRNITAIVPPIAVGVRDIRRWYLLDLLRHHPASEFIWEIGFRASMLYHARPKAERSRIEPLQMSPAWWDGRTGKGDDVRSDEGYGIDARKHRVRVVELNLFENADFLARLRRLFADMRAKLSDASWTYSFDSGRVTIKGSGPGETPEVGPALKFELRDLCQIWCLDAVSNMSGSTGKDGMFITAPRVRVNVREDKRGYDVFIPAFYNFDHIGNCADRDFRHLKAVMSDSFKYGRLHWLEAETIRIAKDLYVKYKPETPTKEAALKRIAQALGVSISTLRSWVSSAAQPEGPRIQDVRSGRVARKRGSYALAEDPDGAGPSGPPR